MVKRHHDGSVVGGPQQLLVEEPMEIRLDGHLVSTTMRTPGHDFELAVGFCHTEERCSAERQSPEFATAPPAQRWTLNSMSSLSQRAGGHPNLSRGSEPRTRLVGFAVRRHSAH